MVQDFSKMYILLYFGLFCKHFYCVTADFGGIGLNKTKIVKFREIFKAFYLLS